MEILSGLDWIIIGAYLLMALCIGWYLKTSSQKNLADFFLGGKSMPWYLAGLSMVATTFAADTPLLVTEVVAENGISGNWIWWNMAIGGMLTTFFFAKLWKRSDVTTELEFINLRYGSNLSASILKYFKAIYLGGIMNLLIMGWVNLAMITILKSFFGFEMQEVYMYLAIIMLITVFYSMLSGLKGVIITDAIQFFIAMAGCILLSIILLNNDKIGGIEGLMEKLPAEKFKFLPSIGQATSAEGLSITFSTFFAFIALQWWASWYPGAEPGGGGYIAQRMMSTKNEKHAFFSILFFQIAHYCIRPWPWILVGLCSLVLYPNLANPADGFVLAMKDFLPNGLKGLLLITFLSAYMSTISTQLNWGTSLIVNDFIKPLFPKKSTSTFLGYSKILIFILALLSLLLSTQMHSIKATWELLLGCGAGLGMVLILRWYWWRISVWSEIAASILPFLLYPICILGLGLDHTTSFYYTTLFTTIGWLTCTYFTPATSPQILTFFYKKIKPSGYWDRFNDKKTSSSLTPLFLSWGVSIILIYSTLFFIGNLLFKDIYLTFLLGMLILVSIYLLTLLTKKQD